MMGDPQYFDTITARAALREPGDFNKEVVVCNPDGSIPKVDLGPLRRGDWMLTFSGKAYYPLDPRAEDVCIDDIAHSLAYQCRYGGHCQRFYSVAEHSVLVSQLVPKEHALVGLMHDAAEAYVHDVPRPLKGSLPGYKDIELLNWGAICEAFDMDPDIHLDVHDVDLAICHDEMTKIMPASPLPLGLPDKLYVANRIECLAPQDAEQVFLNRFRQLWDARMATRYPAAATIRKAA